MTAQPSSSFHWSCPSRFSFSRIYWRIYPIVGPTPPIPQILHNDAPTLLSLPGRRILLTDSSIAECFHRSTSMRCKPALPFGSSPDTPWNNSMADHSKKDCMFQASSESSCTTTDLTCVWYVHFGPDVPVLALKRVTNHVLGTRDGPFYLLRLVLRLHFLLE